MYSISAGLDYPGVGPEHAHLHDIGRARYVPVTDEEAVCAFEYLARTEGIIPAIESAHAVAYACLLYPSGSTVRGQLRERLDALDAIAAVLPAGTLSGAPKIRACQLIAELENNKRGIYGGAVGYIDFSGNMDTCIAIRLAYRKNGQVFVRSGAGIVADSVPENEYQECINKAQAVVSALTLAQEVEE